MKKLIFLIMLLFISCTAVTVPKTSVYTKDQILEIGINEVKRVYGLDIDKENTAIFKSGYGEWKIVLYSPTNHIFVLINEDGSIKSVEMKDYIQ